MGILDKIKSFDWDRDIGEKFQLWGRPLTKKRIFNMYWIWDARQGRGSGYLNEVRIFTYVPTFGVLYLMFPQIPKWTIVFIITFFLLGTYYLGYIDETYLKYWQFDNEKQRTYEVNPYERRIEKRLINIEKKLRIEYEKLPETYKIQ